MKAVAGKAQIADRLLEWYDAHARDLPWRVGPAARAKGVLPDPYRVWLSEVMLQQTTVATVTPRFDDFLARWPTVHDLAAAPQEDVLAAWAGLGYYARARNLHACAKAVVAEYVGVFPSSAEGLMQLPGIGPYTAAAIAAIAFDEPSAVVDGNVERVIVRLHTIDRPIRDAKAEIRARVEEVTPMRRPGDFAQAMMDLGATVCRPRSPQCLICPLRETCAAHRSGIADTLPVKPAKKARPTRFGHVYVGQDASGAVATERRPEKGLFGGMAGLPGTAWEKDAMPDPAAPFEASWQTVGEVEHTLTHFHLNLSVKTAEITALPEGFFWTPREAQNHFPTVFRKALALINSSDYE